MKKLIWRAFLDDEETTFLLENDGVSDIARKAYKQGQQERTKEIATEIHKWFRDLDNVPMIVEHIEKKYGVKK